eukprot:2606333-Rhodomonas_salina.2
MNQSETGMSTSVSPTTAMRRNLSQTKDAVADSLLSATEAAVKILAKKKDQIALSTKNHTDSTTLYNNHTLARDTAANVFAMIQAETARKRKRKWAGWLIVGPLILYATYMLAMNYNAFAGIVRNMKNKKEDDQGEADLGEMDFAEMKDILENDADENK